MKVLIVTNNYPSRNAPKNGIFIHQQVKALQQLGVECYVLLLHNWYPPFGLHSLHANWQQGHEMKSDFFEEYDGVRVHSVPMFVRMPARLFKDNYYDRAARSLVTYVKRNDTLKDADWLYAHFLTDNGYIGAKIKDVLQMKLAAIARGDDVHAWPEDNPSLVDNLRYVFDRADLLLANSGNLAIDTQHWMEAGKKRDVAVAYNGIDHNRFHPVGSKEEQLSLAKKHNLPPGKQYMICIGTPVALKGWVELLEAIKLCGEALNNWVLLMVAPPRNNKDAIDLQKAASDIGVSDKTLYMGAVPPSDLIEILRSVDVFVLPSYNEGMSNALLEAMASGLPCIVTEVGGHNEVIVNGHSGMLVPPRNVPALTTAILAVTGDEQLRQEMGIKARERMIAFADYKENSRKLLALLKTH
ncbi:MAG: glycosyltransferase family 4 protein [Flavipsychrobacter sp.]|nr:glycosyltransferase family 4 protein [Flavipsychrobacter sp.]